MIFSEKIKKFWKLILLLRRKKPPLHCVQYVLERKRPSHRGGPDVQGGASSSGRIDFRLVSFSTNTQAYKTLLILNYLKSDLKGSLFLSTLNRKYFLVEEGIISLLFFQHESSEPVVRKAILNVSLPIKDCQNIQLLTTMSESLHGGVLSSPKQHGHE